MPYNSTTKKMEMPTTNLSESSNNKDHALTGHYSQARNLNEKARGEQLPSIFRKLISSLQTYGSNPLKSHPFRTNRSLQALADNVSSDYSLKLVWKGIFSDRLLQEFVPDLHVQLRQRFDELPPAPAEQVVLEQTGDEALSAMLEVCRSKYSMLVHSYYRMSSGGFSVGQRTASNSGEISLRGRPSRRSRFNQRLMDREASMSLLPRNPA